MNVRLTSVRGVFLGLLIAAIGASVFANSESVMVNLTGNQLKELFADNDKQALTYSLGVADALEVLKVQPSLPRAFCGHPEVTYGQLADVVKKYIDDHPAERHQSAAALAIRAYGEAFPCKKEVVR